jgi:hypothetical protein
VERGVFPLPQVHERLAKFVRVRLWYENDAVYSMLEKRFGTSAIPLYVVLTADDEVVGTLGFEGAETPSSFAAKLVPLLDAGLARAGK